jgi:hypothetical protein
MSLFWSLVLLAFISGIFGLLFVQGSTAYLTEQGGTEDPQIREDLQTYFGSVQLSMLSLYQATSAGMDWAVAYDVVKVTGAGYGTLFIFYVTFNAIAVMNIMTSLFVERATKLASQDSDADLWDKKKQDKHNCRELIKLVKDLSGQEFSGSAISSEMFAKLLEEDKFKKYFTSKGIDIKDAMTFFTMLCQIEGDNQVELNAFGYGCTRLKGSASSVDLHTHNFECKLMHQADQYWFMQVQERLDLISEKLRVLQPDSNRCLV